jgi:EAL domain-containing protein (putative c-di-GMP-specific phosphodiesterase class I)
MRDRSGRRAGRFFRSYPAGAEIFRAGERADCAYIVERGAVDIIAPAEAVPVGRLGPGQIFGEASLLNEGARPVTALAAEPTDLFVIDRTLLQERLDRADPVLDLVVLALLDRLRQFLGPGPFVPGQGQPSPLPRRKNAPRRAHKRALGLAAIERDLRHAIARNQLVLHYQPIVRLSDGRVVGLEALARWRPGAKRLLRPSSFLDLAERSQAIRELDLWALGRACRLLRGIEQTPGLRGVGLFMAVNLSGAHFSDDAVIGRVADILRAENVDPARVKLEITETVLIRDTPRATAILKGLKELGVGIALDDFGTGFSSLRYLHRLPVDAIKVDGAFVADLPDPQTARLIHAIVDLAHNFNLMLLAEGIDASDQVRMLAGLGVEYGQGYHFAKPLSPPAVLRLLRRRGAAGVG